MGEERETPRPEPENSQPDYIGEVIGFFRNYPLILGTLIYLQVSTIGVIYHWTLFREFGINIFDFAEANDFLLAAFKEPFAFGMTILTLLLIGGEILILRWYRGRPFRRGATARITGILIVATLVYTFWPPYFWGKLNAERIRREKSSLVRVQLRRESGEAERSSRPPLRVSLIGTTEKFAFFVDHKAKRTIAIPIANIAMVEFHSDETSKKGSDS